MTKLTFFRREDDRTTFAESRCERLTATLRESVGQQGPKLPASMMSRVTGELVRLSRDAAARRQCSFIDGARTVVRERPELFWLSRGLAVPDGAAECDVEFPYDRE